MRRRAGFALVSAGLGLVSAVVGCSAPRGKPAQPVPSSTSSAPPGCPSAYLPPAAGRPRMTLSFQISADLRTVTGTEHLVFAPDKPIRELVFRLTANSKPTVAEGTSITVTSATGDHNAGPATFTSDNAAPTTQGGLLHLPYPAPIAAGTTVSADLAFTLALGGTGFDRFGRGSAGGGNYAWFGSAEPLLAWQDGYGWHDEPMLDFAAESTTSEAMNVDLTVTAPASDTVIMSGDPPAGSPVGSGQKRWRANLAAARDVSVAIGPFTVSDTAVNGVRLRVGAYSAAERDLLVPEFTRALTALAQRFGPYPFPALSVARIPGEGGGIEYPSSILMVDDTHARVVATHETAHQWFYAMVGNSQDSHPWLDEAFASYAEQLVDGDPPPPSALTVRGAVDTPAYQYGTDEARYFLITYTKGAAALHAARQAAGPQQFDAAIRCYVDANAWRIAVPADLRSALKGLPAAVTVLEKAGAVP